MAGGGAHRPGRALALPGRMAAGIPLSTVLEYARRGVIPGHKLGRRWIFLRDEIEAAVREAPGLAQAPTEVAPRGRSNAARKRPKRYPETVPSPAFGEQRTLFG
jgi:hypothetical protein